MCVFIVVFFYVVLLLLMVKLNCSGFLDFPGLLLFFEFDGGAYLLLRV